MSIGHTAAATAEQFFVSICKEQEIFEPYTCNGLGKVLHEGLEVTIDRILLPLLLKRAAAPMNLEEIGHGILGSITGSYVSETILTSQMSESEPIHHHHDFDWYKVGITTTVGVGTAFALSYTGVGAFFGSAIIAGTTTATGHLYDYMVGE